MNGESVRYPEQNRPFRSGARRESGASQEPIAPGRYRLQRGTDLSFPADPNRLGGEIQVLGAESAALFTRAASTSEGTTGFRLGASGGYKALDGWNGPFSLRAEALAEGQTLDIQVEVW